MKALQKPALIRRRNIIFDPNNVTELIMPAIAISVIFSIPLQY